MVFKALVCDFDDTLVDSKRRQYDWFKEWARLTGVEFKVDEATFHKESAQNYQAQNGRTAIDNIYHHFGLDCDMRDKSHPIYEEYDNFLSSYRSKVFPGIERTLHLAQEKGLDLGILTNNFYFVVRNDLANMAINISEKNIVHGRSIPDPDAPLGTTAYLKKPDTRLMKLLLERMNVMPSEVIHIGDKLVDLQAGINLTAHAKTHACYNIGANWAHLTHDLHESVPTRFGPITFDNIYTRIEQFYEFIEKNC